MKDKIKEEKEMCKPTQFRMWHYDNDPNTPLIFNLVARENPNYRTFYDIQHNIDRLTGPPPACFSDVPFFSWGNFFIKLSTAFQQECSVGSLPDDPSPGPVGIMVPTTNDIDIFRQHLQDRLSHVLSPPSASVAIDPVTRAIWFQFIEP